MRNLNGGLPMVDTSHFAMIPGSGVPRSTFRTPFTHKTTFDAGYLVPVFVDDVLPGDVYHCTYTCFARLAALIWPVMDNMELETFAFFVPNRLVWANFEKFMGEQTNPADSISFLVPQIVSPVAGFATGGIYDYFGLPTVGQVTAGLTVSINALPLRGYHLIYNDWFRDENINNSAFISTNDGPDGSGSYALLRRNKKHDYFTSALPWPLKGGVEATIALTGLANVIPTTANQAPTFWNRTSATSAGQFLRAAAGGNTGVNISAGGALGEQLGWNVPGLSADMSTVPGIAINAMRLSITAQQFLEKDARGGTRYTESVRSHFGVISPDARLQRPEYIGGGKTRMQTAAIPQTSASGLTGSATPQGSLAAQATLSGQHHFGYSATEHGHILVLAHVGAELTYQQGLRKMWSRSTRFDFYFPAFANLGEQAILNKEIYVTGTTAQDNAAFGYQERWAEYRYYPSLITGMFRSTTALNIDEWHLSQQFLTLPTLNATFMADTPPLSRALAAGVSANGQQIIFDSYWDLKRTRAMPQYSVPGLSRF